MSILSVLNGAVSILLVLELCSEHTTTFANGLVSILSVLGLCFEPATYILVAW